MTAVQNLWVRAALLTLLPGWAWVAGAQSAEDARVSFGYAGEIVADAWNPLRVTLRGVTDAELRLELDVGSLRRGPVRYSYRAPLPGGPGLTTFEDDLYLPTWVSFTWTLATEAGVLAEGDVSRYDADPDPLQLVLTRTPGTGGARYPPAARVAEVTPFDLPERAAAYSGVESLLVLPDTAPPAPAALVAAATAGADVLLAKGLGPAFAEVSALAPSGRRQLGAGGLGPLAGGSRAEVGAVLAASPRLEPDQLAATLVDRALVEAPAGLGGGWMAARLAVYALVVLLLVRFGGGAGGLAALLLAATLSLAAWRTRPAEPLLLRSRSLVLGAGGLALRTDLEHVFSFPGGTARLPYAARPLPAVTLEETGVGYRAPRPEVTETLVAEPESVGLTDYRVSPEGFATDLNPYGSALLVGRPQLEPAVLRWADGALVNEGQETLTDVFVTWDDSRPPGAVGTVGRGGRQPDIGPGEALTVGSGSVMPLELYGALTPPLPPGSGIARGGGTVYVALPETP